MNDWEDAYRLEHNLPKADPSRYGAPCEHDGGDWRFFKDDGSVRGRLPEYFDYVCGRACHYLVDANLYVITRAFPKNRWRIVTQARHSTIWNGDTENPVLFDPNYMAFGGCVKKVWEIVSKGRFLKPGRPMRHIGPPFWQYRHPYQRRKSMPAQFESGYCFKSPPS